MVVPITLTGLAETQLAELECQAEYEVPPVVTTLGIADWLTPALAQGENQEHSFAILQLQCRLLLDVGVGKRTGVLELLAREGESFLVRQDIFLVPNPLFHHLDRVGRFSLQSNRLAHL